MWSCTTQELWGTQEEARCTSQLEAHHPDGSHVISYPIWSSPYKVQKGQEKHDLTFFPCLWNAFVGRRNHLLSEHKILPIDFFYDHKTKEPPPVLTKIGISMSPKLQVTLHQSPALSVSGLYAFGCESTKASKNTQLFWNFKAWFTRANTLRKMVLEHYLHRS